MKIATPQTVLLTTALLAPACLFDGEGTLGLPCNVDADCGGPQLCIESVCGGPQADLPEGSGSGDESGGSDDETSAGEGEMPTPQMLDEPCEAGTRECLGDMAIQICTDDRKLTSWHCQAICGMDNPVVGGCQESAKTGIDDCWCENTGGPPSATCREYCSSDSDCVSGEWCFQTTAGNLCLPTQCDGCFASGLSCSSYLDSCTFIGCE